MMVQLKLDTKVFPLIANAFQFHNGTIKTTPCPSSTSTAILFQFHNGTIKTVHSVKFAPSSILFQFHNGTIKTQ